MPRLVNKLPRYTRHKGGQARVRYNGKCIYLGKYGSPESHEKYAQFLATIPKPDDEGTHGAGTGAVLMVGADHPALSRPREAVLRPRRRHSDG